MKTARPHAPRHADDRAPGEGYLYPRGPLASDAVLVKSACAGAEGGGNLRRVRRNLRARRAGDAGRWICCARSSNSTKLDAGEVCVSGAAPNAEHDRWARAWASASTTARRRLMLVQPIALRSPSPPPSGRSEQISVRRRRRRLEELRVSAARNPSAASGEGRLAPPGTPGEDFLLDGTRAPASTSGAGPDHALVGESWPRGKRLWS